MIRSTALAAALALVPLAGCRGVHVPTASETGARKIADAAAKARALAGKIACSPDAVGKTLTGEGGESREIAQTLLAPAQAAAELRTLANEVGAAGGTEPQRREAKTLAARMRRDALLLDLMDLERVAQLKSMVVADIEARIAAVRSIEASGELTAAAELDAQVRSFRAAQDAYGALVAAERRRVDDAQSALQPLEAEIAEKRSGADRLDSEVQELRGAAAVADVARALPIIDEARQKLYKAQDMRLDANLAEQGAEPHRSAVRIGSAAFSGSDDAATALAARVSGAEQAAQGARTRSAAAKARTESLMSELGQLAQELQRLQSELFEPAVKSVEDALQAGDFPSKSPSDVAMVSIAKARFAAIRADAAGQGLVLAAAAGAGDSGVAEGIRAAQSKFVDEARAALVEARDAMSGADAGSSAALMASINGLASALGVDVAAPKPAPPASGQGDESADAPPADGSAPAADAPVAEGSSAPAAEPDPSRPADPSVPPAGDPAAPPADPTPPPAEPGADEPNK